MLEIKMIGDSQTGKTSHAVGLAENWLSGGKSVLFVVPTIDMAWHIKEQLQRHPNLKIIGCAEFNKTASGRTFEAIIFDGLMMFQPNPEGSYVDIARQRLRCYDFAVLAYTVPEDKRQWISTSKWYKPWTWGTGYWAY